MSFITTQQASAASRQRWSTRAGAVFEVKKSAMSSAGQSFDVFLSHAYEDAEVVAGVKALLEAEGLTAYVDWIDDSQASRELVTRHTADMLRARMKSCRFLLYLTSKMSPDSKWMPWELGYFDGHRPNKVGILPIVASPGRGFVGLEYLALYPAYELIELVGEGRRISRSVEPTRAIRLSDDVRR